MTLILASRWLAQGLTVGCAVVLSDAAAYAADGPAVVTCRVRDDARGREFVLRRVEPTRAAGAPEPRWQLSMRDNESKAAWIDLLLPGAKPAIAATTATLAYRNANGGRQVNLEVTPAGSRLDVWVDHGLEVNIEPDLDPRVDRLNTEGPITTLECTIASAAP